MGLVKTSKIATRTLKASNAPAYPVSEERKIGNGKPKSAALHGTLFERVATATEELATGLAEAAAAAQQLRRAMEQISAGADEAAGASQEQLAALKRTFDGLKTARIETDSLRRRTESAQTQLAETSQQIATSASAIERGAQRQDATVEIIVELERRAQDIGEIAQTVSRISDQTNLLALNAAIEAARAGSHGRGFAVVADEIRSLAETSEKSAQDVKRLVEEIQTDVRGVVVSVTKAAEDSMKEARAAGAIVQALDGRRQDMQRILTGSDSMLNSALEAERAALEAQRGAEQVASAAEEQSAGASEAQSAIQQQAKSLEQGQIAARGLAILAEKLRRGSAEASAAEQIGATAEELSATVQELTSAASQIMTAVQQIDRGSQQQASATHETSAALLQIENSAKLAEATSTQANGRVADVDTSIRESRASVERLMAGVGAALADTRKSIATIARLETLGRRIEKIIDAIALITLQTSMLAVSGAVEAARAGDAGRGFAVVSNDIRTLAREASQNVERTKDTVRGILEQIVGLKRDLEQIAGISEIEVQNNRIVFAGLDKVSADLTALALANRVVLDGAAAILASASETAAGARQIAAAAEQARSTVPRRSRKSLRSPTR
jgi:methyl-accepting chemotaxis protein